MISFHEYIIDPNDFKEEKEISKGSLSSVSLVCSKANPQLKYAQKVLPYNNQDEYSIQKFFIREISTMAALKHPGIALLKGFSLPTQFDQNLHIFIEYYPNGTLSAANKHDRQIKENEDGELILNPTRKSIIVYGIAKSMEFLHQKRIFHRDLKPDNIFLDTNYQPVISDFGLSRALRENNERNLTLNLGTPYYMPPEMFDSEPITQIGKADVYSFGLVLYSLFSCSFVFEEKTPRSIMELVNHINKGKRYVIPKDTPEYFVDLIQRCWSTDPNDRPSFEDIVKEFDQSKRFILPNADMEDFTKYVEKLNDDSIKERANEKNTKEKSNENSPKRRVIKSIPIVHERESDIKYTTKFDFNI